jgi:hypothetical protein
MEKENYMSPLLKSIMTSLFVGIVATIICLFFNAIYRSQSDYPLADIINVSSLIFVVNLLFLVIGFVHYFLTKFIRAGELVYIILFAALTLYCLWGTAHVHRSDNAAFNSQFKGLLGGVILIMGILAAGIIPFLFHNRKFEEGILG